MIQIPMKIHRIGGYNMLNRTNSILAINGKNEKELLQYEGKLVVVKSPIREGCYDTIAEVMCYNLAQYLGVPCCEAGLLDDGRSYSVVDRNIRDSLLPAEEYLSLSVPAVGKVLERLERLDVSKTLLKRVIQMYYFDVLTRQLDRNLLNFAFVISEELHTLYPLFDNGFSLFSTTSCNYESAFTSVSGKSCVILGELYDYTKRLGIDIVDIFCNPLNEESINELWSWVPEVQVNGNKKEDIIQWVVGRYNTICTSLRASNE